MSLGQKRGGLRFPAGRHICMPTQGPMGTAGDNKRAPRTRMNIPARGHRKLGGEGLCRQLTGTAWCWPQACTATHLPVFLEEEL